MLTREIGNSGIRSSAIGLGTWGIGGFMWGGTNEKSAVEAIHAAIDNGINLIDTAPVYGYGLSEELVGKAIKGKRDRIILATKCGIVWHVGKGTFHFKTDRKGAHRGEESIYRYLGPKSIRYEIEQSLKRLQTEVIDLYQTHRQDPSTPIEDTMNELLKLKDEGKIRAIGVCNASIDEIKEYRKYGIVDCNQEKFSMLDREPEKERFPFLIQNNIAFMAYSPLCLGLLTGKISPDRNFGDGDHRIGNPRFKPENLRKIHNMLAEMKPMAGAYGLSVTQLVIAWTIHQNGCTHALIGARNSKQAFENAKAGCTSLSEEDISELNSIIERYRYEIK